MLSGHLFGFPTPMCLINWAFTMVNWQLCFKSKIKNFNLWFLVFIKET